MKTNKFLIGAMAFSIAIGTISCGDDDPGGTPLPPIGGYDSADEVGEADLLAYWPLDGEATESISNTDPNASQGATYVAGAKGEAVNFANGYLAYPALPNLSTTATSMSISLWAKFANNGGTDGHPTMLFSLARPNEWAGNINMMSETGWRTAESDTIVMKGYVQIRNGDGSVNGQDIINSASPSPDDILAGHVAHANKRANMWTHYVITWDATVGQFKLYANGIKISNPVWESRNGGQPLPLSFFTPTRPILGTFETVVTGTPDAWQRAMNGQMDEVRVWKKALSAADINALYELELAGR